MRNNDVKHTQNFMTSRQHIYKILERIKFGDDSRIIEIGSGKGHFTEKLCSIAANVTAIEIDPKMCEYTKHHCSQYSNLTIINKDFLTYPLSNYKADTFIFGNIPFNISTEIVKKIVFDSHIEIAYLIVEKGFAKRLLDTRRALALMMMYEANIEIINIVPRKYFHPMPKTDAALICIRRTAVISSKDRKMYHDFIYKWVHQGYRKLFTKNQFNKALKFAGVRDLNYVTYAQLQSIYHSYKLFN